MISFLFRALIVTQMASSFVGWMFGSVYQEEPAVASASVASRPWYFDQTSDSNLIMMGFGTLKKNFPFPDQDKGEKLGLGEGPFTKHHTMVPGAQLTCFISNEAVKPSEVLAYIFSERQAPIGHMDCLMGAQAIQFLLAAKNIGFDRIDSAYDVLYKTDFQGKRLDPGICFGNPKALAFQVNLADYALFQFSPTIPSNSVGIFTAFVNHPDYLSVKPKGVLSTGNYICVACNASGERFYLGHDPLFEKGFLKESAIKDMMIGDFNASSPQKATSEAVTVRYHRTLNTTNLSWIKKRLASLESAPQAVLAKT